MNKALEEFQDLRTAYGGRIDDAIKMKDEDALITAKEEYKKILEKYMNVACKVLSSHTNKPFKVTKKTRSGTVLRGEKSVLRDTESIRQSLNFIQLTAMEVDDIKTALDVVEDYYNKILSDKNVGMVDQTKFSFQIIYGAIITPIIVAIMSLISALILNSKLPTYKKITSLKEFIVLSKNGTDNPIMLLVIVIVAMVSLGLLGYIYISKSDDSILNKKQFMLLPISIISLFMLLKPLDYAYDYLFSPVFNGEIITLTKNMSVLYFQIVGIIILLLGLVKSNYESGDFKSAIGLGHILMIVYVALELLIPPVFKIASEFIDLSIITSNGIFKAIVEFKYLSTIIASIYLIYLLIDINKQVFVEGNYELIYRIICIIVSVLILVGSILLLI